MPRRKYCAGCKKPLGEYRPYHQDVCSKECAKIYAQHIRAKLDSLIEKNPWLKDKMKEDAK